MRELTHTEAQELMALDALDALGPEDSEALAAHLATCASCSSERDALGETASLLALAVPSQPMDSERGARVRARLLARAAADKSPRSITSAAGRGGAPAMPAPAPGPASPAGARTARILAAAAIVLVAAGVAWWAMGERNQNASLRAEVDRLHDARAAAEQQVAQRDSTIADLLGPRVKVISVQPGPQQPSARMFWDQVNDHWTFVAHSMQPAESGRTYQLWLITKDNRKLSAGTFAPLPDGSALVRATYALPADSLLAIAVTKEPSGGSPQPTTTPILVGKAE